MEHLTKGTIEKGKKVLIMLHGRGATANDIMSLVPFLHVQDFAVIAPQAPGYTWYPYSFMAPPQQNEPSLSNAIRLLDELIADLHQKEIRQEEIFLLGFSQGACLTLEFAARRGNRWGGIVAFTGGLIGDRIYEEHYKGNLKGTRVYIGTSDPDPHVPVQRVLETEKILEAMGASVTAEVFQGMGHTIIQEELEQARMILKDAESISPR